MTDTFKMQSIRSYAIGMNVYLDDFQNKSLYFLMSYTILTLEKVILSRMVHGLIQHF